MKFGSSIVFGEEITYDSVGRVASITTKIGSRVEPTKTDVKYDLDGRLVSIKEADQDVWKFIYDKNGNVATVIEKAQIEERR